MRYLARMQPEKRMSGWRARNEAPHRREVWLSGRGFHHHEDWPISSGPAPTGSTRPIHGKLSGRQNSWTYRLFDLGAIACWHLNVMDRAVDWGNGRWSSIRGGGCARTPDFFVRRRNDGSLGG
jgi:hypothetical protein